MSTEASDQLKKAASELLSKKNLERLSLEIGAVNGKAVLKSKFQHWVLLWTEE